MSAKPRNTTRQGEYAEMRFQLAATEHGLDVLRPFGQALPYGFVVDNGNRLLRIQVKSVVACRRYAYALMVRPRARLRWCRPTASRRLWAYAVRLRNGGRIKGYAKSDFDFLVALIIPENAWYIIPVSPVQGRQVIYLYPHNPRTRGKFECYREAWHLLQ